MRCHWEKLGVLGPIYELLSQDLTDREIANRLNIAEVTVRNCIAWLVHFLNFQTRDELVLYASPAQQAVLGFRAA
jgi:DNA-binding CsgD family transcriptional regulator